MNTRFAILSAALSAALSAVPALAAPAGVAISYADLDLATPKGQAQLDRRIEAAAKANCGAHDAETGSILPVKANPECVAQFKAAAHRQVAERQSREGTKG